MAKSEEQRTRREPRKKKIFFFYDRIEPIVRRLNDEQLGKWFRSTFEYELYGGEIPTTGDPVIDVFIEMAAVDVNRGMEAFIATCERNKANRGAKNTQEEQDSPEAIRNCIRMMGKEY